VELKVPSPKQIVSSSPAPKAAPSIAPPPGLPAPATTPTNSRAVNTKPQALVSAFEPSTGYFRVEWAVDARKLRGNDKQAVSPPFEVPLGKGLPSVNFKMMVYPIVRTASKGGACFQKSRGRGYIQVKCEAENASAAASVSFKLAIGTKRCAQAARGPILHNFSMSAIGGLPKAQEEWDFNAAVDAESSTFTVCLQIASV